MSGKSEYHAEVQIRASMLKKIASAFKSIGFTLSGGVLVEFYKKGIVLRMTSGNEMLGAIAISSRALAKYSSKGGFRTVLNHDNILTLKSWSEGKKESIPILLKFMDETITMKYENLNTRTKHGYFEDVFTTVEVISKRCSTATAELNCLGTLEAEPLIFIIDRLSQLKADDGAPDYARIEGDGKELTYYRELGLGEEAEATMQNTDTKAKKQKAKTKSLYETKKLQDLITGFCHLTKEVQVMGATNKPIVLTGAGTSLEDFSKFENDIEYFVILAPKVEDE